MHAVATSATAAVAVPQFEPSLGLTRVDLLTAEDFETASIRSAAPSYTSDAPSYHSTLPPTEQIPPYSPRGTDASANHINGGNSPETATPPPTFIQHPRGLPPIATSAHPPALMLSQFRVPSWSSVSSNPSARHYQRVAARRVTAAYGDAQQSLRQVMLERVMELEEENVARDSRPLEDPYLVGEEAASRARAARLAREKDADALAQENMRWDRFLTQMKDQESRERNWSRFRNNVESRQRKTLLGRINRFW